MLTLSKENSKLTPGTYKHTMVISGKYDKMEIAKKYRNSTVDEVQHMDCEGNTYPIIRYKQKEDKQ
jgi:hypothetical protein